VILAWAWSYWFQKRVFGGGCGAGGGSVGRRGGLSMLLRWCSCDYWRAGTCLESVIGSGSCQAKPELVGFATRGREQQIRVDLLPLPTPPPLSSPSSPLQLRPYYISDVPPFFQPQLSSQLPPSSPLLSVFLLTQITYSSIVAAPHTPPCQSILTYPPK
jgi:hypothetical protein